MGLMMQPRPGGLFGKGRVPMLPGPIIGFGGGSWNVDGSVATLPDGSAPSGQSATALGWGEDEATLPAPPKTPRGIFGGPGPMAVTGSEATNGNPNFPNAGGVSILPPLPHSGGFPRHG